MENIFSFSVYMPLGSTDNSTWARYALNTSKSQTTNIVGLNGQLLEDRNLSWGAQASYGSQGTKESGNLYANYDGSYGSINGGYAFDRNYHRLDYGLGGSLILHRDGLTAGQTFYDTATLVKAPDAASVSVENNPGVKTDFRGYTVVPYATPYRKNDISLDTRSFGDDVEIDLTKKTVIPTQGAITRAEFKTRVGKRAIIKLMRANGEAVPFGASVTFTNTSKNSDNFIVGGNSQVYMSGLKKKNDFIVSWGESLNKQCHFSVNTEQLQTYENTSVSSAEAICQ